MKQRVFRTLSLVLSWGCAHRQAVTAKAFLLDENGRPQCEIGSRGKN